MSDHRHMGGEKFAIEIVALADDHAPAIIRLRQVLKALNFVRTAFRAISPFEM